MNISTDAPDMTASRTTLKIHKYSNRRYYDVTCSRHLTLEQIHKLILDGHDVEVIESKSGEDVTIELLAHIMLEHDTSKLKVFTVELLHHMMRANDSIIHTFMDEYFNKAFVSFLESQKAVKQYFVEGEKRSSSPVLTPLEMGAKWADALMQPFTSAFMPGTSRASAAHNQPARGEKKPGRAKAAKRRPAASKRNPPTRRQKRSRTS